MVTLGIHFQSQELNRKVYVLGLVYTQSLLVNCHPLSINVKFHQILCFLLIEISRGCPKLTPYKLVPLNNAFD